MGDFYWPVRILPYKDRIIEYGRIRGVNENTYFRIFFAVSMKVTYFYNNNVMSNVQVSLNLTGVSSSSSYPDLVIIALAEK